VSYYEIFFNILICSHSRHALTTSVEYCTKPQADKVQEVALLVLALQQCPELSQKTKNRVRKNTYTWHLKIKLSPSAAASAKQMCLQKTLKTLSTKRRDAGNVFYSQGSAIANDLSPRRVLVSGTTHVTLPDDRSWRLASRTSWHSSDKYGRAVPCIALNIMSSRSA